MRCLQTCLIAVLFLSFCVPAYAAIGWADSPPFYLNTMTPEDEIDSDFYYLGDEVDPPCVLDPVPQQPGTSVAIYFNLSGQELQNLFNSGGSLQFSYYNVDDAAATSVSFNGSSLPEIPVGTGCTVATYRQVVTTLLVSGVNTLTVSVSGSGDLDGIIVGGFSLIHESSTFDIDAIVSTVREIAYLDITNFGSPFDGVVVDILQDTQVLRSDRPTGGSVEFGDLLEGDYVYEVREPSEGGAVLAQGPFTIDLSNAPPVIGVAEAVPASVSNSGAEQTSFNIQASDIDGAIGAVTIDLRQIGGGDNTPVSGDGSDFSLSYVIPAGVAANDYLIPVTVVDDLAAATFTDIALSITPSTELDPLAILACGFSLRASEVIETTTDNFSLTGNVSLTHVSSGLQLALAANGGINVVTSFPQSISASSDVTLKAHLGPLGTFDLFHGEFGIGEDGSLAVDVAANNLLDDIAGYFVDPDDMAFNLIFDPPGLEIVTNIIVDDVDGIPGNDLPSADVTVTIGMDGSISGLIVPSAPWDLQAGELAMDDATWDATGVHVTNPVFTFSTDLFDLPVDAISLGSLDITPDGISAEGLTVPNFSFGYGGFSFEVTQSTITNDCFLAESACLEFPLPSGSASSCVYNIEISDVVRLSGGEIRVPPLKIGTYDLAGVYAHFDTKDDGGFVLTAEGELAIPAFATVGIAFDLNTDCDYLLQRFCMSAEFQGRGVPIGNTGILLTDIGGCLADPGECDNVWVISFTAGMSSADRIVPPDLSLLRADVSMSLQPVPFQLNAEGTVEVVGHHLGAAGFELYSNRFHGYGSIELPPAVPFLHANADFNVHWQPSFNFSGTSAGTLSIPASKIPSYTNDIMLGSFNTTIDQVGMRGVFFVPDESAPNWEVTAELNWDGSYNFDSDFHEWKMRYQSETGERIGIRRYQRIPVTNLDTGSRIQTGDGLAFHDIDTDTDVEFLRVGHDNWLVRPYGSLSASAFRVVRLAFADSIDTVDVPVDASPMIVSVIELPEDSGSELGAHLITPGMVVVDSLYCEENAGFAYRKLTDQILYSVDEPEAGGWQIVVTDIDEGEEYELDILFKGGKPTILGVLPDADVTGNTEQDYELSWSASDPDGDPIAVSLYAIPAIVVPDQDPGPWLIAEDLPEATTSFTWQPRSMMSGDYRIVYEVEDAPHMAVADTSDFTISLENESAPWQVTSVQLRVGPEKLRVTWDPTWNGDVKGYRLFYQPSGAAEIDTLDVGLSPQYVLSSLEDGLSYDVWLEAYDVMDVAGPVSDVVTAAPNALGDVEAPPIPQSLAAGYDVEENVVSLTWVQVEEAVSYRIHYDSDVVGPYSATGAVEGDSPILQGNTDALTLTGLRLGVQYYVSISAIDAAGNETYPADPIPVLISEYVDSDVDGLPDDWEMECFGNLDLGAADDPDADYLDNETELTVSFTHPNRYDTDYDQVKDGNDPNPLDAADLDMDGMPDDWENYWSISDPEGDTDADALSNLREFTELCIPTDPDTDSDGLWDGNEVDVHGTDGWNWDTDGGGSPDGSEVLYHGTDPLDPSDDVTTVGIVDDPQTVPPAITCLGTPNPNPFNPAVVIPFALSQKERVRMEVFDLQGRRVVSLLNETRDTGNWEVTWTGRDDNGQRVASGVYFVRFNAGRIEQSTKIVMVK
ncbi:MAG: T9SS type A sorting domain-containing protein [bacterium]|nr:T9SS type A sorting domain-containing protein [bacterium]